MKLILDDEVGWIQGPTISKWLPLSGFGGAEESDAVLEAVDMPKERARLTNPWKCREFIDCSDQEIALLT